MIRGIAILIIVASFGCHHIPARESFWNEYYKFKAPNEYDCSNQVANYIDAVRVENPFAFVMIIQKDNGNLHTILVNPVIDFIDPTLGIATRNISDIGEPISIVSENILQNHWEFNRNSSKIK